MSRMMKLLALSMLWMLMASGIAAEPQAVDTALGNVGLSDETMWQISQPTRATVENANKCRGSFLRTMEKKVETKTCLVVNLMVVEDTQQPTFQLLLQEEKEITEVRVYETLLRNYVANANNGQGAYEYRLLPGEYTYGEESVHVLKMPMKPLKNSPVKINGTIYATDNDGCVRDPEMKLNVLDALDGLERRTMDFIVEVPELPMQVFTIYRTMPQRRDYDEKLLDEPSRQDILVCYGLDFKQSLLQPEQDGLEFAFEPNRIPDLVRTGEFFPVTIQVVNHGTRQTSCLLGRSFSRIPGLNGKLFYFGAVAPGATARFTRYFKIAPEERVNHAFVEIRFSDSWGILKQHLPLDFRFVH